MLYEVITAITSQGKLDQCRSALAHLNAELTITLDPADLYVEEEGEQFVVKIKTSQCRFCPKGVGEAELKGTLCPFPGLIEEFLHSMIGRITSYNVCYTKLLRVH